MIVNLRYYIVMLTHAQCAHTYTHTHTLYMHAYTHTNTHKHTRNHTHTMCCTVQLFTRRAAAMVFPNQRLQRWCFDVELVYLAEQLGIPLAEVGHM